MLLESEQIVKKVVLVLSPLGVTEINVLGLSDPMDRVGLESRPSTSQSNSLIQQITLTFQTFNLRIDTFHL